MLNPWNVIAEEYDKSFGDEGDWSHKFIIHPALLSLLDDVKNKKIIDIGCGTGAFARIIASKSKLVVGLDSSSDMIKIAKSKRSYKNIKYFVCDITKATNLPINNKFDLALLIMVLHSISDIENALKNTLKLIKRNGEIIIVIPHPFFVNNLRSLDTYDGEKYLTSQVSKFTWKQFTKARNIPTPFYLRSITTYSTLFNNCGLSITNIIEPKVNRSALRALDEVRTLKVYNRLNEKPNFIIFKLRKDHK